MVVEEPNAEEPTIKDPATEERIIKTPSDTTESKYAIHSFIVFTT